MIGQTVGNYRVLAEIGGGGMGVVYRAEDLRLGRHVALKVLPPDLGQSPEARERFRREAELISSLNHPHICTLHDVGEHEGRRYLVFELVDGRTLKQTMAGQPLPAARAIKLAADVADALDAAHARGIVHRDVKPDNIMLTVRGVAKLLDFGLARRDWRAVEDANQATHADVTRRGDWVGTPDYMAPEQVRGELVDARADLFALGAVMYEMVTGRAPFRADTVAATTHAVLQRRPARPSALNPRVSADLEGVILKALEKDRDLRYQTAREIVADLRRLSRDSGEDAAPAGADSFVRPPRWRTPVVIAASAVAIGVLSVAVWALFASGRRLESPAAAGATEPARLVVLPFENQTGQAADDWLAGAFSDAISAALQPITSINLVPRERVVEMYEAESRRESQALNSELARQVSQKLRVRYYVHGSYQKVGDNLRVFAKLVDVEADGTRAQEALTDRFANVLALEDALAASMAKGLGVAAAGSRLGQTADLEAQQWFSEARALYARSAWADARPLLQQAVAKDARYAAAWALLSKTDSRLTSAAMAGRNTTSASLQSALDAAITATTLAPDFADAQIALALAYRGLVQMDRMRKAAESAAALEPRSGEALIVLGDAYSVSPGTGCRLDGQPDVAERNYRKALAVDPYFQSGYLNLVTLLWWMDRPVEAATILEQGLAVAPQNPVLNASHAFNLIFANRLDEADPLIKGMETGSRRGSDLATVAFAALKRRQFAEADAMLRRAAALGLFSSLPWTLITSVAQFQAERPAEGAKYLTRAVTSRPECGQWAKSSPAFAPYRDLPEFRQALGGR